MEETADAGEFSQASRDAVQAAHRRDRLVRLVLLAAASVALVVTGAIVWTLVRGTARFLGADVTTLAGFLGHPQWGSIAAVLAAAGLALAAAELLLYAASHVVGDLTPARAPALGPRLRTQLPARLSILATTPIAFAIARESLLPLVPGGRGVALLVPSLAALAYLWILVRLAGGDVVPTRELPGPGAWPRVAALGLGSLAFAALFGSLGPALGFGELGTGDFLGSVQWAGIAGEFSIWSLVSGTALVAGGALAIAGPLGVGAALYLAEFADQRIRTVGKPLVEILAGVPSIVYGFFALFTISPWMQETFGAMTFNAGSAIVVVSVMVLPIVVSLSEDAISAVPDDLRDASLAMGATEWETGVKVVLPAARSGVFASLFLGLARALGETMAVMLAAGSIARWHLNPLNEVQTMTTYIGRVSTGDIPPGPAVDAAFAVGLVLFVITYTVNWGGQEILERVGVGEA